MEAKKILEEINKLGEEMNESEKKDKLSFMKVIDP